MARRSAWWLRAPDGSRRRIGAAGVLIGRRADCDIVLRAAEASRAQALVHLAGDHAHLVPMGRAPTYLGDRPVDGATKLSAGDLVRVPGLTLAVESEVEERPDEEPQWVLEHIGGGLFGVGPDELTVGGGDDDLSIPGLPAGALRLISTQGSLSVELLAPGKIDNQDIEVGAIEGLRPGSRIEIGGHRFRVVAGGDQITKTTAGMTDYMPSDNELPTIADLEFLPRGGRLHMRLRGRDQSTYLADRRCDLVACLLSPPSPYVPGDYVPDEVVLAKVWPGQNKSRTDLNVLVHRVRKDLVRGGADGCNLLVRAPGGGATKFSLSRDARVSVQ